jgi:hypothetical protein
MMKTTSLLPGSGATVTGRLKVIPGKAGSKETALSWATTEVVPRRSENRRAADGRRLMVLGYVKHLSRKAGACKRFFAGTQGPEETCTLPLFFAGFHRKVRF